MADECQLLKAQPREILADTDLVVIPRVSKEPLVGRFFGPNSYSKNEQAMAQQGFRPATISESIFAVAYNFENTVKPQIFNQSWLQAGRIVKAPEWVVINSPLDGKGVACTDESELRVYLANSKQFEGIWLVENTDELARKGIRDLSFVPYGTFKQGVQTAEDFAINPKTNGLARGLEHTRDAVAHNLRAIVSTYKDVNGNSANVTYFTQRHFFSRVIGLDSEGRLDSEGVLLQVNGGYCDWGAYLGSTFGCKVDSSLVKKL
ncbi:MAG: hypothetical protein WCI72_06045 [archaeon]